jgi:hypothetical protein
MAGLKVKTISRAELCALLPENIDVLQSVKPNARWPLYIKTPWGSWFFNSANAQNNLQVLAGWSAPVNNVAQIETVKVDEPQNDPEPTPTDTKTPREAQTDLQNDPVFNSLFQLLRGDDNE